MDLKEIKTNYCKKRYIIPLALALVIGGISIANINANKITYQTQKLAKCTITDVVEASGTINPVNIVSVGSTVSGLMKEIYVDFNSEVKKGQLLAQIDPANFQASVDQNQAQINNAQANLARLNAELSMAEKTYTYGNGTYTLDTNTYTKAGYEFKGWSTTEDGETTYRFGGTLTADVTLHAVWEADKATQYTVIHWQENAIIELN